MTRLLLVEGRVAVREAIATVLDQEDDLAVTGQAGSLTEARTMVSDVDVAVIALDLPDGLGCDLIEALHRASPHAAAAVLSADLDPAEIAPAVALGAAAVLDRTTGLDGLLGAIRRLRDGDTLLPTETSADVLAADRRRRDRERADRHALETLTERELEIMRLIARGMDSHAIAAQLYISERTERNHVANILAKLQRHSRLQALVLCLRYGVVSLG